MSLFIAIILTIIAYYYGPAIRKYYPLLLVLSIGLVLGSFIYESVFFEAIVQGFVGLGFYLVVLFTGAL
jgi:hypothetical protein